MTRSLIAIAAALTCCVASCATRPPFLGDGTILVAFSHFEGQQVRLLVDDAVVFNGILTTEDESTGISNVIKISAPAGSTVTVAIDGTRVEAERLASSTQSIVVSWRPPYIHQSDSPDLLLD